MTTMPDGRPVPPMLAGERATLEGWLDFHRATLELKCSGLEDRRARTAAAEPSSMTPLGLVQHLAEVERNWFQRVFARLDVPAVFDDAGEDGFALSPDRGLGEALRVWRQEVARSRELIADASLDDHGRLPGHEAAVIGDARVSLRWILVHMVEEYA
ncbi:DinB family protein, partial [Streptomyces sp. OF3]